MVNSKENIHVDFVALRVEDKFKLGKINVPQGDKRKSVTLTTLSSFRESDSNLRSGSIFVSLGETFRREGRNEK